ncbi:hypothetical protein N0S44_000190 [Escherichia coli]|nr:hypothetical protein [Escherichia coli]EJR1979040.1 hypothetical protein [Escherichia coli]
MNDKIFDTYNIDTLLTPSDNSTVKMDMYWIVVDKKVFRHKITKVWQCNKNKSIVEGLAQCIPNAEVLFLPYAYTKE